MGLTPGTRLGVYDITASIGEGGMGQVWRATDTTLGRQVAIKVLPDAFASDPERLARFEREAKTLASLNDPHIAAIYGFEKSAGVHALVMELVEGEDLSQRLRRGAMPLDEVLPIAHQIAAALEAAHEQGIIHRDLKPANIKARVDGTVKVLDFGLAKAMDPVEDRHRLDAPLANSPTITSPAMTVRGVILGTAAYMSPEQAAGKAVDKRSDLWSFGVVLLELLTGRPVFTGETVSHVLASVLKSDPDWSLLPEETPVAIRRVLRRCLEKDRKRRIADAADVRLEIEEAMVRPLAGEGSAAPGASPRLSMRSTPLVLAGVLALAIVAITSMALLTVRYPRQAPPTTPFETRTDIVTPNTDNLASFALSPDGRQIVYVAAGDGTPRLWLRSLATTTAQPLAGTEGATSPFWGPDSRSIGFFAGSALKRLDLGVGAPLTLAPAVSGRGATWITNGVILVAPNTTGPLMRVFATGGEMAAVTTLGPQQSSHRWPVALPDGKRFLFYAFGAPATGGIYLGALDGSAPIRLTPADSAGAYLPERRASDDSGDSGWLLWVRRGMLVAQRLDLEQRALTGDAITVADGVAESTTLRGAVSTAATGLVAYRRRGGSTRQLTWVDRSGTSHGTLGAQDGNELEYPAVAPDGRRVAVTRRVQSNTDLWLLDGARTTRLTFDASVDQLPVWSHDGSRIAFNSNRSGQFDLYEKFASGAGADVPLVASDQFKAPTSWSADGRFLLYYSLDPQTGEDLWVVRTSVEGDQSSSAAGTATRPTPSVFVKTPFREFAGVFSPDGRWVAYMGDASGRMEIYVRPFVYPEASAGTTSVGGQWQVSTEGGAYPQWRPDGKEIFYQNVVGDMMGAAVVVKGATLESAAPVTLFPRRVFGSLGFSVPNLFYDVAPDGRFLINTVLDGAVAPITVLMNWRPESEQF